MVLRLHRAEPADDIGRFGQGRTGQPGHRQPPGNEGRVGHGHRVTVAAPAGAGAPTGGRAPRVELSGLVDTLIPGPDGRYDRLSAASHSLAQKVASSPAGRPAWRALHGNEWAGHPLHAMVVAVPVGAWALSGWYDLRSARSGDARQEYAADGALRIGLAGAVVAALTGLAQYVDTRGAARRESTAHASLNTVSLGLYAASWAARRKGRRPAGRRLSAAALGIASVSSYLGGDLSFRHGVGVRPQALRDPHLEASQTDGQALETAAARHL